MAAKTEQFKSAGSNLGRTIGQSLSMITGKDIPNYSLLFLDATLSRKRGEHETIFMPHIVLGRSSRCHVRYGDDHKTVSREHASITVDGSNFVINHNPSASNPTYVNGRAIGGAHHLQNGDEIQLSSNGPKMRFNASTLKTSTIGLTSRIGQAMSQAVKPYKTALLVMGLLLLGAISLAGYNMYQNSQMKKELTALNLEKENVDREIAELVAKGEANSEEMERLKNRKAQIVYRTNTIVKEIGPSDSQLENNSSSTSSDVDKYSQNSDKVDLSKLPKDDVVLIIAKKINIKFRETSTEIGVNEFNKFRSSTPNDEDREGLFFGTGFFTDNGYLITCRHLMQPWKYYKTKSGTTQEFWKQINALASNGATILITYDMFSKNGKEVSFTNSSVQLDESNDKSEKLKDEEGEILETLEINILGEDSEITEVKNNTSIATEGFSDWAKKSYANRKGSISISRPKSENLKTGTELYILGYSQGLGLDDKNRRVEPAFSDTKVSQDYTFNGEILTSGLNFGPGNSGGPAMIYENGRFIAVGIVTTGVGSSNAKIVPMTKVE